MKKNYIPLPPLESFDFSSYRSALPYPHHASGSFLTPEAFETLRKDFPALKYFGKSVGRYRGAQRPHDRFLLAFERSVYQDNNRRGKGTILRRDLPDSWKCFIEEIESASYKDFAARILGTPDFKIHCEWHMGFTGSEVSPHCDAKFRLGSHLFYFNTPEEWDVSWGGSALLLGDRKETSNEEAPDFFDFKTVREIQTIGNQSLLFENSASAWHGVRPLKCPAGKYRRVFVVIFLRPESEQLFAKPRPLWRIVGSKIKNLFFKRRV